MVVTANKHLNVSNQSVGSPAALIRGEVRVLANAQACVNVRALKQHPRVAGLVRRPRAASDLQAGILGGRGPLGLNPGGAIVVVDPEAVAEVERLGRTLSHIHDRSGVRQ